LAKIVFSAVVGDARKKAGGVVFTKGRTGAVIRRKVSPVQPRTQAQRNVRSAFTGLSKYWGATLTDTERSGWTALAVANPRKDQFGQTKTLTGLQMFQSCNRNLDTIGITTVLAEPPAALTAESPGTLTVVATSGGTPALTVSPATPNDASDKAAVFAAAQVSAGRTFIGKRYRFLASFSNTPAPPWDILAVYTAKFGALVSGKKVPILVKYIETATGGAGTPSAALQSVT